MYKIGPTIYFYCDSIYFLGMCVGGFVFLVPYFRGLRKCVSCGYISNIFCIVLQDIFASKAMLITSQLQNFFHMT